LVFHVEVNFSSFPFGAGFGQEGRDQAQEGSFIGKEAGHAGAAFDFLVDALDGVGGAQAPLMGRRQRKNGQALRQVFFHPGGEFRSGDGVAGHHFFEAQIGRHAAGGVEDAADGFGHFGALVQFGHVGLGILLEVELAALPGARRETQPCARPAVRRGRR
jgi:hypothetical protein